MKLFSLLEHSLVFPQKVNKSVSLLCISDISIGNVFIFRGKNEIQDNLRH